MKQRDVFNKIGTIITELNEQYKYLGESPVNLNDLELELFVANSKFLADHAEILIRLNNKRKEEIAMETTPPVQTRRIPEPWPPVEIKPVVEDKPVIDIKPPVEAKPVIEIKADDDAIPPHVREKYFEPVVQPKFEIRNKPPVIAPVNDPAPSIDLSGDTPEDSYSFIRQEPEVIRHELEVNEADFDEEIDYTPATTHEPETIEEPAVEVIEPEAETVIEEPVVEEPVAMVEEPKAPIHEPIIPPAKAGAADDVVTINQKMAAGLSGKTVAATQPIDNLKQAISLNDKLWFVKDLFNGYSLAYSEAIEILNRFTSIEEAERFLEKNYVVKNKWAEKPEATEKFYGLLRRRYII